MELKPRKNIGLLGRLLDWITIVTFTRGTSDSKSLLNSVKLMVLLEPQKYIIKAKLAARIEDGFSLFLVMRLIDIAYAIDKEEARILSNLTDRENEV